MTPIEKIRLKTIKDTPKTNEVYNNGEELYRAITINPLHPTCILEGSYHLFNNEIYEFCDRRVYLIDDSKLISPTQEGLVKYFEDNYPVIGGVENKVRDTYNHRNGKDKIYISMVCADTQENMLNAFFVKQNSLSYSNGSSVKLMNSKDSNNFSQYFYGDKEGIGRYAAMGGNMD